LTFPPGFGIYLLSAANRMLAGEIPEIKFPFCLTKKEQDQEIAFNPSGVIDWKGK
jgi:hypothetical protein